MKTTILNSNRSFLLAALIAAFALGTVGQAMADDGPYRHDAHGYWDEHQGYHHFDTYHNHHGYWHENNGVRIFINVD
jgi:hypothetical protein